MIAKQRFGWQDCFRNYYRMSHFNTAWFFKILIYCFTFLMACGAENTKVSAEVVLDFPGPPCDLLHENLVKKIFDLPEDVTFDKTDEYDVCMYGWSSEDTRSFYSLSLNFASGGKRSDENAREIWDEQDKIVYKGIDMLDVHGVGQRASWSSLGGGQLRVLAEGYIFFVSFFVYPEEEAMSTEERIDKAAAIAEEVIEDIKG